MGNTIGKVGVCFSGPTHSRHQAHDPSHDEGLGHSFCYIRPDPTPTTHFTAIPSSKIHSEESTSASSIFHSISGASVSANTSTPLTTAVVDPTAANFSAAFFESSTSFSSVPLQPIPRSGPLSLTDFMSGPIDRSGGFMSGPLERAGPIFSGPLDRSYSVSTRRPRRSILRGLRRVISNTFGSNTSSVVAPKQDSDEKRKSESQRESESQSIEWAQGKAGEDRVHVVVSEERGWVFVGIYDGFNGPDATDFLLSNLYPSVQKHLKGLLWEDGNGDEDASVSSRSLNTSFLTTCSSLESCHLSEGGSCESSKKGRWKCEWDKRLKDSNSNSNSNSNSDGEEGNKSVNHSEVLRAFSRALRKTEESYLGIADKMLDENPELALMGSCVLAMLMKGEDVYVMNVGDSRAVLAQTKEHDHDLEMINEEALFDFHDFDGVRCNLRAFQLTIDHSTSVDEEVQRIRDEHPDDAAAVVNDRVKGSLKVTRAFGAGFLKQKKWNDALLEMFRIDYVGNSPYINCLPFLYHHRLGPKDRFLILSSDGLYQYFTNEEAVSEVELFISMSPEGDPAQHLVEEVLFRAAKRAGLDFYELLEIPQGDRRKYHDDVSIIVISFEGRIWRSCL